MQLNDLIRIPRATLVEGFAVGNLSFLIVDVFIAHSFNSFAHPAEWIPIAFCALAVVALIVAYVRSRSFVRGSGRWVGLVVGWTSILVGIGGMVFHLESNFFQQLTLRDLVYSAPFAAPLAFTGLGFLLLLNRMMDPDEETWSRWVIFLAWGGFVGNFILSLADHAQNGFFYATEWIPVLMSAVAVGFFVVPVLSRVDRRYLHLCLWICGLQVLTGLTGFVLHVTADLGGGLGQLWDSLVFGAPPFAPLLFADIALLAALGTWDLSEKLSDGVRKLG